MKITNLCVALGLVGLAEFAPARAQCPGLRAVDQDARVDESSGGSRCRRVLSIFGLHIGLGGSFCPDTMTITPARRVCQPVANSNTDCEPTTALDVQVRHCHCTTLVDIDLGIAQQDCECSDGGTAGTVNDHKTFDCKPSP